MADPSPNQEALERVESELSFLREFQDQHRHANSVVGRHDRMIVRTEQAAIAEGRGNVELRQQRVEAAQERLVQAEADQADAREWVSENFERLQALHNRYFPDDTDVTPDDLVAKISDLRKAALDQQYALKNPEPAVSETRPETSTNSERDMDALTAVRMYSLMLADEDMELNSWDPLIIKTPGGDDVLIYTSSHAYADYPGVQKYGSEYYFVLEGAEEIAQWRAQNPNVRVVDSNFNEPRYEGGVDIADTTVKADPDPRLQAPVGYGGVSMGAMAQAFSRMPADSTSETIRDGWARGTDKMDELRADGDFGRANTHPRALRNVEETTGVRFSSLTEFEQSIQTQQAFADQYFGGDAKAALDFIAEHGSDPEFANAPFTLDALTAMKETVDAQANAQIDMTAGPALLDLAPALGTDGHELLVDTANNAGGEVFMIYGDQHLMYKDNMVYVIEPDPTSDYDENGRPSCFIINDNHKFPVEEVLALPGISEDFRVPLSEVSGIAIEQRPAVTVQPSAPIVPTVIDTPMLDTPKVPESRLAITQDSGVAEYNEQVEIAQKLLSDFSPEYAELLKYGNSDGIDGLEGPRTRQAFVDFINERMPGRDPATVTIDDLIERARQLTPAANVNAELEVSAADAEIAAIEQQVFSVTTQAGEERAEVSDAVKEAANIGREEESVSPDRLADRISTLPEEPTPEELQEVVDFSQTLKAEGYEFSDNDKEALGQLIEESQEDLADLQEELDAKLAEREALGNTEPIETPNEVETSSEELADDYSAYLKEKFEQYDAEASAGDQTSSLEDEAEQELYSAAGVEVAGELPPGQLVAASNNMESAAVAEASASLQEQQALQAQQELDAVRTQQQTFAV